MNIKDNRVLAYALAKTIPNEELDEVSGGHWHMTSKQTLQASGNSAQGPDVIYDVSVDI